MERQKREAKTTADSSARPKRWLGLLGRIAALVLVIALTAYVFSIREQVERFARFGYAGIFLFTLLTYATVILPAPGTTVVTAMGAVLNPFWVGVAAGLGATLGELTGYAAGYSGEAVIHNIGLYKKIHGWLEGSPGKTFLGLVVFSAIPNPMFDMAGIAAGVLRVPLPHFLAALFIGETLKMWLFAYAGAYSVEWILRWMR